MKKLFVFVLIAFLVPQLYAQAYQIALLKYRGGGDWYANLKTSLPNLIEFANREAGL